MSISRRIIGATFKVIRILLRQIQRAWQRSSRIEKFVDMTVLAVLIWIVASYFNIVSNNYPVGDGNYWPFNFFYMLFK